MNSTICLLFSIGWMAFWLAWSVHSAPVLPSSFDVELVDVKEENADNDFVESSMITPFPTGNPGDWQPDEPNFFWSGSGDDPDAGMTYWITKTVYKTAVVTMTPDPIPTTIPATISPTPPIIESALPVWPMEVFQPRNWIRTVIRSDDDETSPRFRQSLQSRLGRIYSQLLSPPFGNQTGLRVYAIVQNVTRRVSGEIDVIYALSTWNHPMVDGTPASSQLVDPYIAVSSLRQGDVTRELCHRPVNDTRQDGPLCRSVVTLAELFMRPEETNVAATVKTSSYQYWIIGAIVGAVLVICLIIILVYLIGRNQNKRMEKKDVAVGHSPTLPKSESIRNQEREGTVSSAQISGSSSKPTPSKSAVTKLSDVEHDPDPWVRKARSTSKKHRRKKWSRPQTAPERNLLRESSSSLSTIVSGSASSISSSLDRMDYKLSHEEPIQPSRSARKLKRKRTVKADVLERPISRDGSGSQPEPNPEIEVKKTESQPVGPLPKPRLMRIPTASVEMEIQEVTADFTGRPESPENDEPASPVLESSNPCPFPAVQLETDKDNFGWRPGSLIPSRVSRAVFGSRKVSSAPYPLEGSEWKSDQPNVRRAWMSSDHVDSIQSTNIVDFTMPVTCESSEPDDPSESERSIGGEVSQTDQTKITSLRHPPLHIHSVSYPGLIDRDPAIELIRSIKEELKKFDPKIS